VLLLGTKVLPPFYSSQPAQLYSNAHGVPPLVCHPERSECYAKRSPHAVEGSLFAPQLRVQPLGVLSRLLCQHRTLPRVQYP